MGIFRSIARGPIVAFAAAWMQSAPVIADDAPITIIALGDSLVSGNGLAPEEKFASRLQAALDATDRLVKVVHPGYVHDSKWGLEWMTDAKGKALLAAPQRQAVILELGSNDCPGLSLDDTRANLDRILSKLAEKKIPTLLVGSTASTWCDPKYIAGFPGIFPDLADKYGSLLYADFEDGVAGHPDLLQEDGDHPNSAGEAIVVERMLPSVLKLLDRVEK